jgi:crossover junction endodeoxyribonuclease RuvC
VSDFVLAFDASLDGTGYAVLDKRNKKPKLAESGVVKGRNKTWGETPHTVKLALIRAKVEELVAKYQPLHPTVYIERGFVKGNKNTQAIFKARGALESALVGFEIEEISPTTVKKLIANYGFAEKEEVGKYVKEILGIEKEWLTDDESDAVAVALAGLIKSKGEIV